MLKLIVSLLMTTRSVLAQGNVKNLLFYEPDKTIYTTVEKRPEFPGGRQAMYDYLKRTVQYPLAADSAKIQGKVVVSFIVRRNGQLTNVEVVNGLGYGCDEEAIRVVETMPRWQPGKQSGREQNVRHKVQVFFGVDYPQRDSNYQKN